MQQFPAVFFPPELWCLFLTGTGLQHSVSLIQSCSLCFINKYIMTVLTLIYLQHTSSKTKRNKNKILRARCIFSWMGWWSIAFNSQSNPGSDEEIIATLWINLFQQPQEFLIMVWSWTNQANPFSFRKSATLF